MRFFLELTYTSHNSEVKRWGYLTTQSYKIMREMSFVYSSLQHEKMDAKIANFAKRYYYN